MENYFSGSEIVELGIQIEINGKEFYEELAKRSLNQKAKTLFQYLSDEERKHILSFQEILSAVQSYDPPEAYPEDYFSYMNALAAEHVFTKEGKGKEIAQKTTDDKKAIDLGIQFERDSIVFYEGIKKAVPQSEHQLIDSLITQEQDHLKKLNEVKELDS